ncbi:MAG: cysteine--tRNA ligase [Bacteroidales bacterium]|jgi:cysteinyl-tRNA synthetase|nr:cysteine--tRNA ligase [Bacteroidales bacterium]MDD4703342.1 cysteine--tRNA ligase [Bacteroidales bacterium]MDX9797619.1 cysteine--tRNA ligase [Bacteroidales bacterium]
MELQFYNTLSRKKEIFQPINPPHVGMYVCGPTVYGDAHLGHARPGITFDIIFRYLNFIGYKVRYVRNITDVGHLENDSDDGEDKIAKKARLEEVEPMEIAQFYTMRYLQAMDMLNVLRPSIQPTASGHIIEQIEIVKKILDAGYAYVSKGSVYFDVLKYHKDTQKYGILSNRVIEDMLQTTRELDGQDDKNNPADFALWKKAEPEHIMRWPSPWSEGFPGWHLECTAMSAKYLGEKFDIHGGGLDLLFPHHESEIAQSVCAFGHQPTNYWVHNNMITIEGKKMGKSLNNFITLEELFNGTHRLLKKAYSPMTIRFFILQAHYRSTLDFSNDALTAAEKGLKRLLEAQRNISKISPKADGSDLNIKSLIESSMQAMNDDFNTPIVISHLFSAASIINSIVDGKEKINSQGLEDLKTLFNSYLGDILGIKDEQVSDMMPTVEGLVNLILDVRKQAREEKNWAKSDEIRDKLAEVGVKIKDSKDGVSWSLE